MMKQCCRISCGRFGKIAYFKLSWQLWSMVDVVEYAWWRSNTSIKESVWRFSRTFQPFLRCITVFLNVLDALIVVFLVLHNCQVCPYGNSSHCLQSRMCSDSSSFHSNSNDFNCAQQCLKHLKTLEEYPYKFHKLSYQIPQDNQETKDLNWKPNSSASSPWHRSLSVPDHPRPWHWQQLQHPKQKSRRRHCPSKLPRGGVSHLGEQRQSSVGSLRRLFWCHCGEQCDSVYSPKAHCDSAIVVNITTKILKARFA